jgi:hypothetical protein
MTTRERRSDPREAPPAAPVDSGIVPDGTSREEGDAFLDAADAAIERALSGTPETFLEQNRQLGGQ